MILIRSGDLECLECAAFSRALEGSERSPPCLVGMARRWKPETLVTTYHDLSHPLSISAAAGGPAMSNQVRVGESDLHEMWAGRVGEGSQELYDKSVACGVVTEFTSETPGTPLM